MPKIDETRLRNFHRASENAHAALIAASERVRSARKTVAHHAAALDRAQSPIPGVVMTGETESGPVFDRHNSKSALDRTAKKLPASSSIDLERAALAEANAALTRALAAEETAQEAWEHAATLWRNCRTFAAAHGALPVDLQGA